MYKVNDVIRHINRPGNLHTISNIDELGITCDNQHISWDEMFYYELVVDLKKENARNALVALRSHIDHDAQVLREKDARMLQLFDLKETYRKELKQKQLRVESAERSEFVIFCMFLGMTVSFVFMFGLWMLG